jgi:PAP2 superfamily
MSEIHGTIAFPERNAGRIARDIANHLFPDIRLWLASSAVLIINGVWLLLSERIGANPGWAIGAAAAFFIAVMASYGWVAVKRGGGSPDARLYMMLMVMLFTLVTAPALLMFNHLVMSLKLPMADEMLIAADRSVGFNWLAYATTVASHPWLKTLLQYAYNAIHIAIAACLALHVILGKPRQAAEFAGLLVVSGIVGSAIGIFFPAIAAMAMLGTSELVAQLPPMAGRYFVEPLLAMRSADMLTLNPLHLEGLTALPSYHATLALLCVYSARMKPWAFIPMAVYAAAVIASTPVFGGHYLADILAAAVLTAAMIWAWRSWLGKVLISQDNALFAATKETADPQVR